MKNIFKKVICLVLALSMCAGMVAFAAEEATAGQTAATGNSSLVDTRVVLAMDFLRNFGVIADYYETNVNTEEIVTRADFANSLAKLMNLNLAARTETYYYDVPPKHFANAAISSLAEMNLINGVGDNCFEPDEYIETAAACKILLNALGYNARAQYEGGYPTGYVKVAKALELIDADYDDVYLKRGDMFVLLLNAIKTPMFVPVSFSDSKGNLYQVDENETILSNYYDSFYTQGTVQGARGMSINETDLPEVTYVEIDGVVYNSEVDLSDMIGEKINFIARNAKGTEDATVFWAERANITKTFEISAKQYAGFDATTYKLYYANESGEKKSLQLSRALSLVYNGGLVTENISSILGTACDFKIVYGQDDQVVIAKKKAPFVVNSAEPTGEVLTNYIKDGNPAQIVLDSDNRKSVVLKNSDGAEIAVRDIAVGNSLMVYESLCGNYIEIITSRTLVTGFVSKIRNTETGRKVTIGDNEYNDISGIDYVFGQSVTAYLDAEGDIIYATSVLSNDFAAYVISMSREKGAFQNQIYVKMFKQNGTFATYGVAEEVIVDGVKKDSDAVYDILMDTDGKIKPQVVLVKLDKNSNISYLDTVAHNTAYEGEGAIRATYEAPAENPRSFMYNASGYLTDHWDTHMIRAGAIAFNASTVVFRVPEARKIKANEVKEDDFGVGWGKFANGSKSISKSSNELGGLIAGLYKTTDKVASFLNYIVIEANGGGSTTSTKPFPMIVESTGMAIDEEGDLQYVITGYDGSTSPSVKYIKEDAVYYNRVGQKLDLIQDFGDHNRNKKLSIPNYYPESAKRDDYTIASIKKGMVVEFDTNEDGLATAVAVIYDPEAAPEDNYFKIQSLDYGTEVGVVVDMDIANGLIGFNVPADWHEPYTDANGLVYPDTIKDLVQVLKPGSSSILVYDTSQERNNVYAGSLADIRLKVDETSEPSMVLIYVDGLSIQRVYIFN